MTRLSGLTAATLILAACGGETKTSPETPEDLAKTTNQALAAPLVPLASCDEVSAHLRTRWIAAMNEQIDQRLSQLAKGGESCSGYGSDDAYASGGGSSGGAPVASGGFNGGSGASEDDGAKSASGTNNQVVGVDEADFIKNDNKYMYVAANGAFRILDAFPAAQARELARVPIEGEVQKLFVEGNRALVYTKLRTSNAQNGGYYGGECTYGYDCTPSADGSSTRLLVFDISDKSVPIQIRSVDLSGSLIAARRIGNAIHTVVADPASAGPTVETWLQEDRGACTDAFTALLLRGQYEELRERNRAAIEAFAIEATFPSVTDSSNAGGNLAAGCPNTFRTSLDDGQSFTTLVSIDLAQPTPPKTTTIVSRPGHVYASTESLYLAVPHTRGNGGWYAGYESEDVASDIHQFAVSTDSQATRYRASGLVKGGVLNQFAMDEHEGKLRVATSAGHVPSPNVHSTVSVLETTGASLSLVGKIDHIAPTEDIRSVRWDGDRGYIVTFKKTDPLYVIDASVPQAPAILGELKIPGFSTYMHMMDATHLLTIGYDADDQGSFAYFTGILLQIFDVSDPRNPRQTHVERIGTRGSSSEALSNHLAFNYFAEKNLLSIPLTVCEAEGSDYFNAQMTFSGLAVYDVTAAGGFVARGRIEHPISSDGVGYSGGSCSNWWSNASSQVKRSVIMDDTVYSVALDVIKARSLGALSTPLTDLPLQ